MSEETRTKLTTSGVHGESDTNALKSEVSCPLCFSTEKRKRGGNNKEEVLIFFFKERNILVLIEDGYLWLLCVLWHYKVLVFV